MTSSLPVRPQSATVPAAASLAEAEVIVGRHGQKFCSQRSEPYSGRSDRDQHRDRNADHGIGGLRNSPKARTRSDATLVLRALRHEEEGVAVPPYER